MSEADKAASEALAALEKEQLQRGGHWVTPEGREETRARLARLGLAPRKR